MMNPTQSPCLSLCWFESFRPYMSVFDSFGSNLHSDWEIKILFHASACGHIVYLALFVEEAVFFSMYLSDTFAKYLAVVATWASVLYLVSLIYFSAYTTHIQYRKPGIIILAMITMDITRIFVSLCVLTYLFLFWNFDRDYIDSGDCFWWYSDFHNIDSSNSLAWEFQAALQQGVPLSIGAFLFY